MPWSRIVLAAAAALVALHATTDAFLAPEAGTSWRDHLAPGLASIGALAAAVALWPRLRPGARAVTALVLGALALEGFGLALADARQVGPRGDDWTGFLLAPAGAALCALGVALLWRSRRPGRLRHLRRGLLALAALAGAYWLLLPFAVSLGATHRPRAAVSAPDLGRPYEQVTIRTRDGLDLAAWYVPSRNGAAVVSFPTRRGKPAQARMLARHGYGVLLLDMRGYDGSEGDPNAFGWGATPDLDAAVAWLARRADVHGGRVGGIGFSVGGELLLQAAAANPGLRAVVSEGAGERSVRETLIRGPRAWLAVPAVAVQTAAVALFSGAPPPPALDDLVARIAPRAVFLIYAGRGAGGEDLNERYYRAAGAPKQLWRIPEARHVGGYDARPQEYERRVVAFFDRYLA